MQQTGRCTAEMTMHLPQIFTSTEMRVRDLGLISWDDARDVMRAAARNAAQGCGELLFCEHPPTITRTQHTSIASILSTDQDLEDAGIEMRDADRGGDVTFHGPGQLICYPVFQLSRSDGHLPVGDYVRGLERIVIETLSDLGVPGAHAKPGLTGIWVHNDAGKDEKLAAIGVGLSPKAVTRHGFALNIDIDLDTFLPHIIPCGLADFGVTTLRRLDSDAERSAIIDAVQARFAAWVSGSPSFRPDFQAEYSQTPSSSGIKLERGSTHPTDDLRRAGA